MTPCPSQYGFIEILQGGIMSEKKDLPDNITVKIDSLEMENVKRVPYETDDETIRRWRDGVEKGWL